MLFPKLISVWDAAIRCRKTRIIVLYILIPFPVVLNHLSHFCSLWKLQSNMFQSTKKTSKPKLWRLIHCLNFIYKIAQQIKQHYENKIKNKHKTWQSQCLISRQSLKVYGRFWKLKLWWKFHSRSLAHTPVTVTFGFRLD